MNTLLSPDKYVFNPTAKTVTFIGVSPLYLQSIFTIFNVTDGICIYDFGDPLKGGSVANNVLTLTYDTASMSATDSLLVKRDDGNVMGVDIPMRVQEDTVPLLRRIIKLLEASGNADIANRQRIVLDAITGALTLATVTTVGTVSNVATLAGYDQRQFIDTARVAYNTGVRQGLIFT